MSTNSYISNFTPYEGSAPRAIIYLGNTYYLTPVNYEIEFSSYGAIDTARITLSISDNPDFSGAYKGQAAPIPISIYAGFPSNPTTGGYSVNNLTLRFQGLVDQFECDFGKDELIIHCRSLAAYFIANKHTTNFNNQNTLYVVNSFSALAGLTPNIALRSGQTSATLAQVFGREFVTSVRNMREWDILVQCAQADQVDVWVKGSNLYYMAPELINHPQMGIRYGQNMIDCKITHQPFYSTNITVEVRSWSTRIRTSSRSRVSQDSNGNVSKTSSSTSVSYSTPTFGGQSNSSSSNSFTTSTNSDGVTTTSASSSSSTSTGGGATSGKTSLNAPGANKETYIFYVPNLTPAQCDAEALKRWKQMSLLEYLISFTLAVTPGNLSFVDITALYVLTGCPWPTYDQTYRPRKITENFDQNTGWTVKVEGCNHDLPSGQI
jgi:hypothetical protein